MIVSTDIDIDLANREDALNHLTAYRASILKTDGSLQKHASGVYFSEIPHDIDGNATIDYKTAEDRGYFKVDLLNVAVYENVTSEEHLVRLMQEPDWNKLTDRAFFEQLIHIGNYYDLAQRLPEPINSIPRMAMFLAMIRPAKKHLIGLPWKDVAKDIWTKPTDDEYYFKKAHGIAYAHLVVVHINLLSGVK